MSIISIINLRSLSLILPVIIFSGCATSSYNYDNGVCQQLPAEKIYKNNRGIEIHEIHHIYTPDADLKQMAVILALKVQKLEEKVYGKSNTHIQLSPEDYESINPGNIQNNIMVSNDRSAKGISNLPKVKRDSNTTILSKNKKAKKKALSRKGKKSKTGTSKNFDIYEAAVNAPVYKTKAEKGKPAMVIKKGSKVYLSNCSGGWCKLKDISGYTKITNYKKGE